MTESPSGPVWDKTQAEALCTDLLQFAVWRAQDLTVGQAAARMHITSDLARRYERAITELLGQINAKGGPRGIGDRPRKEHAQ